ncbi:amidase [Roridomyces roridus]|uniref:Amidase n=1 Tax=Roridomyces roridus TaxID=1738132 RepID=A0AAD7CEE4_9AGAR|nr:amidase [Roridomyces roridus]
MAAQKRAARDRELELEKKLVQPDSVAADRNVFLQSTAKDIVGNIEKRVWTASQVLEVFIAQSVVAHGATNCITEVMFGDARARAKELDVEFERTGKLVGPLHGVPISVKDQYDVKGYDTTIGFTSCINKPAQDTADFVQCMISAGAVPFLKTNVPQTMYAYECNNPLWGATTNPYNAAYTSGGSSGGEACMLALDAAVIGLGSDIGGSLRIPASYCGVYSLKPGIGRVSDYGAKGGCMDDLELACRVSFGAQGSLKDNPPVPFREVKIPEKLRFGYYTSDGVMKASPACARAVHETIRALEKQGHECIELNQDLTPRILNIYLELTAADGYKTLLRGVGSDPLDASLNVLTFTPKIPKVLRIFLSWAIRTFVGDTVMSDILRVGGERSVEEYHAACVRRNEIKQEFYRRFWDEHQLDGIITHVHASPGCLHGGSQMMTIMSASTATYNLVDSPCGVVPVTHVNPDTDALTEEWIKGPGHGSSLTEAELYSKGRGKAKKPIYDPEAMAGLPIGVQIIGRLWEDEKVLGMMRVVDDALGKQRGFTPGSWEQRLQIRTL